MATRPAARDRPSSVRTRGDHDDCRHQEIRRAEDAEIGRSAEARPRQGPHRPRPHRAARSSARRLLRHADADRPVREHHARRCAHDHRAAVGEEDDPGHREGDPRLRPGAQSRDLRRRHPRADAAAHRGAAQGAHQGRAPRGRRRAHRGAQHPPRRERPPEEAAEGPCGGGGRRAARADRRAEAHRSPHRGDRQGAGRRRKPT